MEHAIIGPHPDVVLEAPTEDLTETEGWVYVTANQEYGSGASKPTRRRRKRRTLEHPALDLYGGYEGLLVRTALIRSEQYESRDLPRLSSAIEAALMCRHLVYAPHEYLVSISLNNRGEVLAIHEAGIGPAGNVAFTLTQVIKVAFLTGGTSMIAVHNHPSGDPQASEDDKNTTSAMAEALRCVGLQLVDHIIVATDGIFSFEYNVGSNNLHRAAERDLRTMRRTLPWPSDT